MSKSDKTRPAHLKALDDPSYVTPVHDHRLGACDLPDRPPRDGVSYAPTPGHRCYWGASATFWASPAGRCGCRVCSASPFARADRRRDRHNVKRALRQRGEDGI